MIKYAAFLLIFGSLVPYGVGSLANLRAVDIERNLFQMESLLFKEWAYDVDVNETGPCHEILNSFSVAASQFILCANAHAKPISMCRECFPYYINVTQSFQDLKDHSESGMSCIHIFTSQDRMDIIEETYRYIAGKKIENGIVSTQQQGLWHKGNCESCYSTPFDKNSVLSATTVDFFARHVIVNNCFNQFPYRENIPRNSSKACQVCLPYYQNLSDFYEEYVIEKDAPYICDACIDIVDAMNMTQRQWGEKYNCGRKLVHHIPMLVMVSFVLCIPIVFYTLVRLAESSAEERVISQRNITNFLGNNIRRLSFNRRSRVSRSSRNVSREQYSQGYGGTDNPVQTLAVPNLEEQN